MSKFSTTRVQRYRDSKYRIEFKYRLEKIWFTEKPEKFIGVSEHRYPGVRPEVESGIGDGSTVAKFTPYTSTTTS